MTNPMARRQATCRDLRYVATRECNEPFAALQDYAICCGAVPPMLDMAAYFAGNILVRRSVAIMLQTARQRLSTYNSRYDMCITYGYRANAIQKTLYRRTWTQLRDRYPQEDNDSLTERVHARIAVPSVAGHPTGGAVDVMLVDCQNTSIDMGCRIYDFRSDVFDTWASAITQEQRNNRLLLRRCMMEAGFAPFDGEWWHFSYGDREWAWYYRRPEAIYAQQSSPTVLEMWEKTKYNNTYGDHR